MIETEIGTSVHEIQQSRARIDKSLAAIILILSLLTYSYIFQGIGWNQIAHFGTIRSIVENGTPDISRFTDLTMDTTQVGNRQYSSKLPGFPLIGIPFYFVLFHIERFLGAAYNDPTVWGKNLHAMTVLLCALPGAILNVLLYFAFRREGATRKTSMVLAGGFAFGSLSLPYTGLFMSHVLCSMLAFAAWFKLTGPTLDIRDALIAGGIIGYATFCDLLVSVITIGLAMYVLLRSRQLRCCLAFAVGPSAAILALFVYGRLAYGHATEVPLFHPTYFMRQHYLFGQFTWPDVRRIYWITYQPMRGLFACCPEFVLCLITPFLALSSRKIRARLDLLLLIPIVAGYALFYMTFLTWNGGYCIGPRFLIPMLPILWMLALRPFQRWPIVCGMVIALSIIYMLAVTSVCAVSPAVDGAPPTSNDPVSVDLILFIHGKVTDVWMSETIGGLMGMPKKFLIIPFLLPVIAYFGVAFALPRKDLILREDSD
jgi:hypothetical protein